ncbi:alpha/beta hydrolase [Sediminibacterium ginsengisoli]|uniref:S-formylglutathione hydrolase FrmB n=1 Tax=Sediminibacterium ginsengisoli TaxID=413434 RepID=A0A1T4QTX9_9BACT|nr:alpha/beta hydrolase family protein [Sediminibacterium ginsengisoli]SKA07233.1 S-formylglutathione hydrolase FrmB [Sediminibacterium ginsengisoli]
MKRFALLLISVLFTGMLLAATVDTVSIYSNSMKKEIKTVVVKPARYGYDTQRYPVVYLLHGHGGGYANWITRVPHIQELADRFNMIIVCPDGAKSSWYYDSPIDPNFQYETFVAKEVPAYIDSNYKTIEDRTGRAITGLSMGGHGGMFIGFRHADFFSACGSMSGALNTTVITRGYNVEERLGDTATNRKYWEDWSVMKVIETYPKDSLAIIVDCGTEDMIVAMSRAAHEKMLKLKIPHDYIERPGKHDWKYWNTAVDYQMLFFRKHFDTVKKKN